jgi:hypothetical protein
MGALRLDGLIYVIGCISGPNRGAVALVYAYGPPLTDGPRPRRYRPGSARGGLLDGRLHATGGRYGSENAGEHEAYDPKADSWTP